MNHQNWSRLTRARSGRMALAAVAWIGIPAVVIGGAATVHAEPAGPIPPLLYLSGLQGSDHCPAAEQDADGYWQPGESVELFAELQALGTAGTNIQGVLHSTNPGVAIIVDSAAWPDIPFGQTATSETPFHFVLATSINCPGDAGLQLTLTSDQGEFGPFDLPADVGSPFFADLPVALPDITHGTEILMNMTEDLILTDIDVRLVIEHTWVGDLAFTLRSPAGTEVLLLDRPGVPATHFGCSDDDMDITFDDDSSFDPENYCPGTTPWYVGVAHPVESLSEFIGESTLGIWTLIAVDLGGGDLGVITDWELHMRPSPQGQCEICTNPCPSDISADGSVDALDLAQLLGGWGPNPGHPADLDGDGLVNAADLAELLGNWGPCV